MNKINIALASDDNYAQHVAVVMASIIKNSTRKAADFFFYVIDDNIGEEKKRKILTTADLLKTNVEFLTTEDILANVYTSGHISKAAYLRLALPNLLPNSVNKIIYLDVDLLVLGDIEKLWNIDISSYPLAAVPDFGIMSSARLCKQKKNVIGLEIGKPYFNSGVMVLNIDYWREHNSTEHILGLISQNSFPHHDQDALNKEFLDKWVVLSQKWNVIPPVYFLFLKILKKSSMRNEAISAKLKPSILHYAGRYKPWEFEINKGYNEKYYEYLFLTDFKDVKMPQPGRNMKGKSISRTMWRLKLSNFWAKIFGVTVNSSIENYKS